jgi:hypothetical protein
MIRVEQAFKRSVILRSYAAARPQLLWVALCLTVAVIPASASTIDWALTLGRVR